MAGKKKTRPQSKNQATHRRSEPFRHQTTAPVLPRPRVAATQVNVSVKIPRPQLSGRFRLTAVPTYPPGSPAAAIPRPPWRLPWAL